MVGLHQFPVDNVGSQQFRHLHKICVHKVFKVLHTKLEMITGRGLKIHTASFVQCLQPKGVFQIPHGLIHGKECGLRVVCEEPKPFGIPRLNLGDQTDVQFAKLDFADAIKLKARTTSSVCTNRHRLPTGCE